ncbi:MAG: hypothetical protein OXH68_01045 [Gammaproteobacteria bacterium]|nr:hypothetical protein [Gammaproteobacteria bacterium]
MGLEAVALGITQITAVVAMGVFIWQVFSRRFDAVDAKFDKLEAKVEDLAKDHQSLARELSEFRGEMRGRLDALPPIE